MTAVPFITSAFATADAGTIGHERTLPARLNDIINVRDYGATGNGTTDDWAAIMAAFNHDKITLVATANSVGNVMTFGGGVPQESFHLSRWAFGVDNPAAFDGGNSRVFGTTSTTVTVGNLPGTVLSGQTVTFNLSIKGTIYFPPGTYKISAPIDVSCREDGQNQTYWNFLGCLGASIITANFADYIFKFATINNGNSWSDNRRVIEKLTLVNTNVAGGGIRLGCSICSSVRDCDITANFGINSTPYDTPSPGDNYSGSLEMCIDNCNFRAHDALLTGSFGSARCANGPTINCTFKDFETGARNFAGEGSMHYQGCLFEHNSYGHVNFWAPGHNYQEQASATSGVSVFGCYFKNNGVAIFSPAGRSLYSGLLIEATEGAIAGNPQYGIFGEDGGGCVFSGIKITGQYQVAGFKMTGTHLLNTCSVDAVSISNTSTLGGVAWALPTLASGARFTACNVTPVYTMTHLPAFPIDIATASWNSGTGITTLTTVFFDVSQFNGSPITITLTGATPSGYNGSFSGVTVTGPQTLTYSQSNPGSPTGSGGIAIYNVAHAAQIGDQYNVSDASTATWGALPVGGGSTHAKVRWGNSDRAWTVVGK